MKKVNINVDENGNEYVLIDNKKFYLNKTGSPTVKEFYYELSIPESDSIKKAGIATPGDMIAFARKQCNMTQQELADKLKIKQNTLSRYENKTRQVPFELFSKSMDILGFKFKIEKK